MKIPKPLIKDEEQDDEVQKQLHDKLQVAQGIYIGDVDRMLQTVESQMPIVNSEQIYLWELEKHGRIYLAFVILGMMFMALGFLI